MNSYTTLLAPARPQVHPRGHHPARLTAVRATKDMCSSASSFLAAEAADYVAGENFEIDCLALGFDPDIARERIGLYVHRSLHPKALQ